MIKRGILGVFIALAITFSGFSDDKITVKGTAPTFATNDPNVGQVIDDFNKMLGDTFDEMVGGMQGAINDIIPPEFSTNDLLKGFGTSSVFASHGATMWAYADYKFMSISIGSMFGLKFPNNSTKIFSDSLSGKEVDFDSIDNLTFGINPQFFSIHVGINPSALFEVFPKNLFLGLRLGFFGLPKLPIQLSDGVNADLNFSTFTIGVTAIYQLVPSVDLAKVIKWRGVNISSGIIFQTTKLDFTVPFDEQRETMNFNEGSLNANLSLVLNPTAALNMNVNTVTIPIEVSTAIKLLFLNIPFGIGFDIGLGKSDLSIGMKSDVNIESDNNLIYQKDKGIVSVSLTNDNPPSAFNFKIMTGLGFTFGDKFMIDIPLIFYITDGYTLGFTFGVHF